MLYGKNEHQECKLSEGAEFIEIFWNWTGFAVSMVSGVDDAVKRYQGEFEKDDSSNLWIVKKPSTWMALLEHNKQYCSKNEAELLASVSLAMRPTKI